MDKSKLHKLIDVAAARQEADLVIKNGKIIDVYQGKIIEGDIAISHDYIAGIGNYKGKEEIDVEGAYVSPGFIDGHIHIESSYMTPEEFSRLVVPLGTTTVITDPHEITNVCGIDGLDYMIEAAASTALDIRVMVPSCVPSTPFENSGAVVSAKDIENIFKTRKVHGLAEFMNSVGVINNDEECVAKLAAALESGRVIDGHAPDVAGNELNAYIAAGISTDHECSTIEDMDNKLSRGMYILLRHGSACHDLENLLPGVNEENYKRCLLCSDDRQIHTIFEEGHVDDLVRRCIKAGIKPIHAIRMATLNAAECYGIKDIGGIAPGKKANLVVFNNLEDLKAVMTFIDGKLCAKEGKYLLPVKRVDVTKVSSSVNVKDFSEAKLKLELKSNRVKTMNICPDGVLTKAGVEEIELDDKGDFVYNKDKDIVKIAVVERHHATGNVGVAFLKEFGIKEGAIALSVAHDSHNIIAVGTSNAQIAMAVNEVIKMTGGIAIVHKDEVKHAIPLTVAGIMSTENAETFNEKLAAAHKFAHEVLKVDKDKDPFMVLCFMALPVIPELKITDMGLFDVNEFKFTSLEA